MPFFPTIKSLINASFCYSGKITKNQSETVTGDTEASLEKLLEREREDGLMLARCVEELKRKGLEFDLMKEVDALRRAKSLHVETTKVASSSKKWSARDFATMVMLLVSFAVLGLIRFVLCS